MMGGGTLRQVTDICQGALSTLDTIRLKVRPTAAGSLWFKGPLSQTMVRNKARTSDKAHASCYWEGWRDCDQSCL